MKLFSPIRMLQAHRAAWQAEQANNNPEAVDLATRKMNFIIDHGTERHIEVWNRIIDDANALTEAIYMLPLGTPESEWADEQAEIIRRLDLLITQVERHSEKTFS